MKKNILFGTAICCVLIICSCKHEKSKTGNSWDMEIVENKTQSTTSEVIPVERADVNVNAIGGADSLERKHWVVIGSFRDSINARQLVDKMKKEKYDPVIRDTVFNLKDTMYRVIVASFDDSIDATLYKDTIIKIYGPQDTWIRGSLDFEDENKNSNDSAAYAVNIVDSRISSDVSIDSKTGNNTFNWAAIWKYLKKILMFLLYIILILLALAVLIGIIYLIFKFLPFVGVPHAARITNAFSRFKPSKRFTRPTVENKKVMKNRNDNDDNDVDRNDDNHYDDQNDDDNDDEEDGIKNKLLKLYVKNIPPFQDIHDLTKNDNVHGPLLMSPGETYLQQPYPFLAIGRETKGWEKLHSPVSKKECVWMMDCYEGFNVGGNYQYKGSPFWSMIRKIETAVGGKPCSCAWTNISKYDRNKKTPDAAYEEIFSSVDNLLYDEIKIINPKFCIFFTSPKFDYRIKKIFKDAEFLPVSGYTVEQFCQIRHKDLPILTFRTYHPQFLRRKRLENKIVEYIDSLIVK